MTEIILIIVLIVLVIVNIVVTVKKKQTVNTEDLKTKLITLASDLSKIDPMVRDESRRSREETQNSLKQNREELNNSFKLLGENIFNSVKEFNDSQQKNFTDLLKRHDDPDTDPANRTAQQAGIEGVPHEVVFGL